MLGWEGDSEGGKIGTSKFANKDNDEPGGRKKNKTNNGPGEGTPSGGVSFGVGAGHKQTNAGKDNHTDGNEGKEGRNWTNNILKDTLNPFDGGDTLVGTAVLCPISGRDNGGVSLGNKMKHHKTIIS